MRGLAGVLAGDHTSWEEITNRVKPMNDRGIKMIFLQAPEFLFQVAATELLKRVKGAFGY